MLEETLEGVVVSRRPWAPPDLLNAIKQRFDADVYVTYGLTEAGCILTFSKLTRDGRGKIDSVGRPHLFVVARGGLKI